MDRAPELMSDQELVHALDQADADLARIDTRRLRLVAALDSSGYAEQVGARDTVQYLEYRYRLDHYRARRDVHLARALPKYTAITAALPDITDLPEDEEAAPAVVLRPAQAEAIVTALEKVPATVPVADLEVAERELVRLARHLPPAELRKAAEQARDILDTDGPEPEEQKASARETLTLMTADRGVKFKGYLANENAELFRSLIFAGAGPHKTVDGEPDPRTREKRQADALTTTLTLAATALDAGTPSPTLPRPTTPNPPTPNPTAPTTPTTPTTPGTAAPGTTTPAAAADCGAAQTRSSAANGSASGPDGGSTEAPSDGSVTGLAGGATDGLAGGSMAGRACGGAGGSGGEVVPGFGAKANITVTIDLQDLKAATADALGDTVYGPGLSAATIRRLACDAKVIPIVLGSNSEPLDVGRCERLVTRAMRRALNTRDRGCVVCGAPPIMCDAHHLISWIDGGDTKLSNLALLCRRHHTDLHNGHWTITITNGQVHVTRPTWADPPPHPRQTTAPPPAPARSAPDRPPGRSTGDDPIPDRQAPDHPRPDHKAVGDSTVDSAVDQPAADEVAAGDLRAGGDRGSLRADGSVRSVPGDSVAPAETGLRSAPGGGRLRDEAPSAPTQDDAAAVRDATYLAIWGERPPADRRTKSAHQLSDRTPFDPWDESSDLTPATTAPEPP
ncbi:HNH endonuclease signature motif containing protein [Kribbella kalugense]|uniref:HNH endonuclease n=1 Tax=Kribbella kalugense TaxID=2512221 RepID=A0A4R7ZQM3_9ACTN|nr:HNH endonuclease signature motif containing protein [Kribbella kalugense]TDW18898.1 HNH endonuclease [Kribbella kalugense]